jgi:PurA ssDNA and RNA-binding protein
MHGESQPRHFTPPIASERFDFERKRFYLDLKESERGRVLKITEEVGRKRNTIMLPTDGAGEFLDALKRLIDFEARL